MTALSAPATVLALMFSGAASPAAADPPPIVDGTTQLGACDSLEAVSFTPRLQTASFVCIGPGESTDFGALRTAYATGGMRAVATEAAAQYTTDARVSSAEMTAAGGPVQFTSMVNEKTDDYRWTYNGTVIYGTINTKGQIVQYGKFSIQNKIALSGNSAQLGPFWVQRALSGGSAMKFRLWFWYEISTGGGLWHDTSRYCAQSAFSGNKLDCSGVYYLYHYDLAGKKILYGGKNWYGRTKAQWWNEYSPNPTTADGSWTLRVGHGPMDCLARAQRCQWR